MRARQPSKRDLGSRSGGRHRRCGRQEGHEGQSRGAGDGGLGAASALLPLGDQVDGVAFVKPETSGRGTDFRTGTEAAAYVLSSGWRARSTEIALSLAMRKFTATGDSRLTSWLEARYIQLLRRGKCRLEGF